MKVFQGAVEQLASGRDQSQNTVPRVYSLWGQCNGHLLANKVCFAILEYGTPFFDFERTW